MAGIAGTVSLSRACHPLSLPGTQPWTAPWSLPPPRTERPIAGPLIGVAAPRSDWIGAQWAPGQGGDTPGGGGAATQGQHVAVVIDTHQDGYAIPVSQVHRHRPGNVGRIGARRSGA